ncbi:L-threonate dehydrogenase-like [Carya illinoinensis]|uniref:L-threonate dehydrogenase-like n=1 Tax=Carya illinoinensis TaxID=32201 RepID=UPI001C72376B|nr:L-threonate dehydrogenase-like [Carya illinoinensis]
MHVLKVELNPYIKLNYYKIVLYFKWEGHPADGVAALIVLISHADNLNDVIFGNEGALKGLHRDVVVILCSTLLPSDIRNLEKHLTDDCATAYLVDAYVSRGKSELLDGKVMITSSGRSDAIARAQPFLSAMCDKLYIF